MNRSLLQWHPAFQAVLQIELSGEAEYLQFLKEYNLTDGPLRADTLIIKKEPGYRVQKNIGRIFRRFNIVEYKNPWESLTVRTYYQAVSYASVLQSRTEREDAVLPEEITLTLVGNHYPRKLFHFLKKFYGARVEQAFPGIYYVEGAVFPTQVIIQRELPGEENVWLSRLRQDLEMEEDVPALAMAYRGKEENPLYSEAMDLIVTANWELYKESEKMCNALNELFAEKMERERVKGLTEGERRGLAEGERKGRAEGEQKGRGLSVLALLEELGQIPSSLREKIMSQQDTNVLTDWLKAAAAASSLEDFRRAAKL